MSRVAVQVHRHEPVLDLEADLQRARVLARLMDSEFSIGGFRFGLDAVAGLVPVVGDTVAMLAGIYPIMIARKHKLGKTVEMRMWANLMIDYGVGLVPLAGDVFDAFFKANLKNLALLEKAAKR